MRTSEDIHRDEVVIVFADGDPNHGNGYDDSVAATAINNVLGMKEIGVDVYSISVADNADASKVDGTSDGNKFMHYLSNNYPAAQASGNTITPGAGGPANGYYLTPDQNTNLDMNFDAIIQNIGTPTIELGVGAAVIDTISNYFTIPGGANSISLYTADADRHEASGWKAAVPAAAGITAEMVADKTLKVTGFDFDANYISTMPRDHDGDGTSDFFGRKLTIIINVTPDYNAIDAAAAADGFNGLVDTNLGNAEIFNGDNELVAMVGSPKIQLNKIIYTYIIGDSNDETEYAVRYRLGGTKDISVLPAPTKTGYTFSGWTSEDVTVADNKFDMPAEDIKFTGNFVANTHKVNYVYSGSVPDDAPALPAGGEYKYGEEVTVGAKPNVSGYTFVGWTPQQDDVVITDNKFTMPDEDVTLIGHFLPGENTPYKIEHYLEVLNGDTYELKSSVGFTGKTNDTVTATPNSYSGFTFNAGKSVTSGTIAGDGSLVLKLYYDRNTYEVTYKYEGDIPANAPALPAVGEYKYGAAVTVAGAPTLAGYTFEGWRHNAADPIAMTNGGTFTMPAANVEIIGNFVANAGTEYKVEHYLANQEGNYNATAEKTETFAGTTGHEVTAEPLTFTGFTYNDTESKDTKTGTIASDGSLTLKLYYDRNAYTVTYEYNGVIPAEANAKLPVDNTSYKYGDTVTVAGAPEVSGYTFHGWTPVEEGVTITEGKFVMPAMNVRLSGHFHPDTDTPYRIEHYLELVDDTPGTVDYPTIPDFSDARTGTTGASVTVYAHEYTGYTLVGEPTQTGTITNDGSTVFKFYYKLNSYEVNYQYEGTVPADAPALPGDETHKYGATVTVAADPDVAGYTFNGWTDGAAVTADNAQFKMPAENVTLTGKFVANTDTVYTVNHWLQNVVGDTDGEPAHGGYYKLADTDNLTGTTGEYVSAKLREYFGFSVRADNKWSDYVQGDGSLVIDVYYDRHTFDVTYMYYGVAPDGAPELTDYNRIDVRYGTPLEVAAEPTLADYIFDGWYTRTAAVDAAGNYTMPNHDVIFAGAWDEDTIGENPDPHTGDEIADKYQKMITFKIVNGTWADTTDADIVKVVTLKDAQDKPAADGTADISAIIPTDMKPDSGYGKGQWDVTPPAAVSGTDPVTYTYAYTKSGGGGGGGGTVQYTLTYNSNGGTRYDKEVYNKGAVVSLVKEPTKEGYIFDGWHMDAALAEDTVCVTMNKNITVYAAWIADNGNAGNGTPVPDALNGEDHFAYVIGYPDETVRPKDNINRAEVTSIFFRLLKDAVRQQNLTDDNAFVDVNEANWYNTAVSTIAAMDIVAGRPGGQFAPYAYITRAEFAAIAARFDDSEPKKADGFSDIAGHWAEADILKAAANGWIKGYTDKTFRPNQFITRAEAMTLINRVLNRVPENTGDLLSNMIKWKDNSDVNAWYYIPVQEATNSHEYTRKNNIYERWTAVTEVTDWTQYQ